MADPRGHGAPDGRRRVRSAEADAGHDGPRAAESRDRSGAQFWSIYIPGEIKDRGYARVQLEQIDIARRMIAQYPDRLELALTAADIGDGVKAGKIASLLGMEGGHAIENSLGALRSYYELGARYMTLTHNVTLDWADAALDTREARRAHAVRHGSRARDEPARACWWTCRTSRRAR